MASILASLKPQHEVVIKTERLLLRVFTPQDLADIHNMRLNPAVMQYMPGVETEKDALKSYSVTRVELMMKENMFSFAILLANPTQQGQSNGILPSAAQRHEPVIGFIGITSPPSLFYIFDEKYWGNGYATETLRAFLQTYWERYPDGLIDGPDDVKGQYLEASVAHGNAGSENVVKKCGFVLVGEDTMHGNGRSAPTKLYRLLRPEN